MTKEELIEKLNEIQQAKCGRKQKNLCVITVAVIIYNIVQSKSINKVFGFFDDMYKAGRSIPINQITPGSTENILANQNNNTKFPRIFSASSSFSI